DNSLLAPFQKFYRLEVTLMNCRLLSSLYPEKSSSITCLSLPKRDVMAKVYERKFFNNYNIYIITCILFNSQIYSKIKFNFIYNPSSNYRDPGVKGSGMPCQNFLPAIKHIAPDDPGLYFFSLLMVASL
ncbi:MAG: hypothetical protein AB1847_06560, partial [bacterium]